MKGDPVRDIIKSAWENGVNFIDTAEGEAPCFPENSPHLIHITTGYAEGQSEREMFVLSFDPGARLTGC